LSVERKDFDNALKRVQPSAMREVMVQVPHISWDDVGGLDEARDKLREGVELPLKHPEAFRGSASARPRASCSMARRAPARPAGQGRGARGRGQFHRHQVVRPAEQMVWRERAADRRLFARARQVAPTVIFIDELDSLVPARGGGLGEPQVTERVVNTILAEMDGLEELNNVVVIGATNRPNLIDPALLRPGPVRRAHLCRHARYGGAAADPGDPHQGHAASKGCRPRITGAARRAIHRCRP
jgi:transitional endoplasmic reticulum ATPase